MSFRQAYLFTLLAVVLLTAAFIGGYRVRDQQVTGNDFPVLVEARQILDRHGIKPTPNPPALEYGMIRGMLQAYDDPYTIFVEPPQHKLESQNLQGKFGGIGVRLGSDAAGYLVLYPLPDSPARKAGLQEGDRLLAVDHLEIKPGISMDTAGAAIRGKIGQTVIIKAGRAPDYTPFEIMIKRQEYAVPSLIFHLAVDRPEVGVIETSLIAASTPGEIRNAVQSLQARGAKYFVLDLRDNPGGLLTAGVDTARLFLKEGLILQDQYRGKEVDTYQVEKPGALAELPLIVMINHGSASAAEIVAGALQVHRRALLVGMPSFGKDTIQLVFDLQDKSSLHVTSARWWIPGMAAPLSGKGLQPDILIEPADKNAVPDRVLQAAIQALLKSAGLQTRGSQD